MKLMSFQVQTPDGPAERVGALIDGGCLVDLTSACYVLLLTEESCDRRAAARIARALVPPDMVAFIEGGKRTLSMAKEALAHVISREKAFAHFMSRGEAPDGTPVVYPLTAVASGFYGVRRTCKGFGQGNRTGTSARKMVCLPGFLQGERPIPSCS
jgi:hypothetical protein